MKYHSLTDFIEQLEAFGELVRIKEFIDPELQITEIADRFSKQVDGGKALLFENTKTDFPLLINAFGSDKRMKLALGVNDLDEVADRIDELVRELSSPKSGLMDKIKLLPKLSQISSWMPKKSKGKADCQEVVNKNPDLTKLPVLKCWPADGGRFVTLPMVITKDPNTGIRNVGMYRLQIFDEKTTGMHWHRHKTGARHFEENKKLGKKMPIAVALGGDPVLTYSATAPLPDNIDEFLFAGFLRNRPVEMVKCITQDLEVPAEADIVIEGYVDPNEEFAFEGPFGDHTGFYSLPDYYPRFHVTCITHRKNAVYPATIVGIPPMEDAYIAKATERIFLSPIKITMLPEVEDLNLPFVGVGHNITIVKIDKKFPGQALRVMSSLWGAGQMMFNKIMLIVDKDLDIHNYKSLLKECMQNIEPSRDIHFSKGPLDVLDHASDFFSYGSKMGIDATRKFPEELQDINQVISVQNIDTDGINYENLNINLLDKNIPVVFVSVDKDTEVDSTKLASKILKANSVKTVKFIIITDKMVDVNDVEMVSWLASGNIDPVRDCKIINNGDENSCIVIDGTTKDHEKDNFKRSWPNVIVSKKSTIKEIDNIWEELNIGEFIDSPSLKYMDLSKGDGAFTRKL